MGERARALGDQLVVKPGDAARLRERDTAGRLGLDDRAAGEQRLAELVERIGLFHNRLWAENTRAVLLVLQGLDAAGKDGTIRHVLSGVNPQGCRIVAFKVPAAQELEHDYLWRVHAQCPERGELAVFNRSHYEDLVTARVRRLVPPLLLDRRAVHVREFERLLVDEGTTVVKVFLHISKDEQRARLQARLDDPEKNWKFRLGDLDDRVLWDEYQDCYERVLTATSTEWAPWHVVPADHKWVRNVAVATLLVEALERIDPQLPQSDPALRGLRVA